MQRTPVNPWDWSQKFGFHQAEILTGTQRHLICAGQAAVDAAGEPQHAGDMAAQMALAMDNLESVLREAGMGLQNVTGLTIYVTDMDATLQHFGVLAGRLGAAGVAPPQTLIGVTRLAWPTLMVEITATAAD
jgi:enamine deaminase RidA (YjgF/YER057c/UK114 family)